MIVGICGKAGSGKDTLAAMLVKSEGFVRIGLADPLKRFCRDVFGFTNDQLFGASALRNAPDLRYLREPRGCHGSRILAFDEKGFAITEPVPREDVYLTPRHALQQLGTDWGRACHADIWAKVAIEQARLVLEKGYGYSEHTGAFFQETSTSDGPGESEKAPGAGRRAHGPPAAAGVVISDVRFRNELKAIRAAGGVTVRIVREGSGLTGVSSQHRSELEMESFKETDFDAVLTNDGTIAELEAKVPMLMEVLRSRAGQSQ